MILISRTEFNPFNANFTKWSNILKQFVGNLPTNFLSVFEHFVGLALKELSIIIVVIDVNIQLTGMRECFEPFQWGLGLNYQEACGF